jgi:hypothetical protein
MEPKLNMSIQDLHVGDSEDVIEWEDFIIVAGKYLYMITIFY